MWHKLWFEPDTGKMRCWWRALIYLVLATLVAFLMTLFLMFPVSLSLQNAREDTGFWTSVLSLGAISAIAGFFLVGVWALRTFEHLPAYTLGLSMRGGWWRSLFVSFLLGMALLALLLLTLFSAGVITIHLHAVQGSALFQVAISMLLLSMLTEITVHGYAFQTLMRGIGPLAAILLAACAETGLFFVSSIYFTHHPATLVTIANIFLFIVLLGMVYLRVGNLWPLVGLGAGWQFALLLLTPAVPGESMPLALPLTLSYHGPWWLYDKVFGFNGGVGVSLLLLGAIALVSYLRYGLPIVSHWWEWTQLAAPRRQPPAWDYTIGTNYYQWKLLVPDRTE